jgi:nickel/cobalt transporter (NiCoT) family protein
MSITVLGSAALALGLGLRHGLDADHLAAIDGLTRFNMVRGRGFARFCGALFSAGHGAVIVTAASLLALWASAWTAPEWLDPTGKLISAAILLWLGTVNLRSLSSRSPAAPIIGIRTTLLAGVVRSSHPWQILLVGAFFALSFDALGLAVLFAARAARGDTILSAMLAVIFAGGMILVDTFNGLWLARLAARSDRADRAASRAMTIGIALISLAVGVAIASSWACRSFDRWLDLHELAVSLVVVLAVLCAYLAARPLARERALVRIGR